MKRLPFPSPHEAARNQVNNAKTATKPKHRKGVGKLTPKRNTGIDTITRVLVLFLVVVNALKLVFAPLFERRFQFLAFFS